ncbi:hypothetical protein AB0I06_17085 [Streptomyces sp. NPDC050674]|uniref:hypothetical protein n=1 Tax=Streptomyces sp. NPDC050674 TaxID=3157216 RepID=UPI00342246CC
MTSTQAGSRPVSSPTALRAVSLTSLGVFLVSWAMCAVNAYALQDDLPSTCGDLRRQSFPPEVACASAQGTLTGANAGWIEALFFTSLVVFVLCAGMVSALATVRRK